MHKIYAVAVWHGLEDGWVSGLICQDSALPLLAAVSRWDLQCALLLETLPHHSQCQKVVNSLLSSRIPSALDLSTLHASDPRLRPRILISAFPSWISPSCWDRSCSCLLDPECFSKLREHSWTLWITSRLLNKLFNLSNLSSLLLGFRLHLSYLTNAWFLFSLISALFCKCSGLVSCFFFSRVRSTPVVSFCWVKALIGLQVCLLDLLLWVSTCNLS